MVNVIANKAVLAQLSITQWGARRHEDQVADKVTKDASANRQSVLVTKRLLARKAMAKIQNVDGQARVYHGRHTQPWMNDGVRILSSHLAIEYMAEMGKYKDSFFEAVEEFVAAYPAEVEKARISLGRLFDPSDYPDVAIVRKHFTFSMILMPCPDSGDFRCTLDPDQLKELQENFDQCMTDTVQVALRDTAERILHRVGNLAEKLKAYQPADKKSGKKVEGRFHDSLVDHVKELADLLPAFNLSGDPKLDAIHKKIVRDLTKHSADDLRDYDGIRRRVANSADEVLKKVKEFMV